MRIKIVTVSSKGQFTIPKDLREHLGMQPGDKVELWVARGKLRAWPVKPVPKPPRLSGSVAKTGFRRFCRESYLDISKSYSLQKSYFLIFATEPIKEHGPLY